MSLLGKIEAKLCHIRLVLVVVTVTAREIAESNWRICEYAIGIRTLLEYSSQDLESSTCCGPSLRNIVLKILHTIF